MLRLTLIILVLLPALIRAETHPPASSATSHGPESGNVGIKESETGNYSDSNSVTALLNVLQHQIQNQSWEISSALTERIIESAKPGSPEVFEALLLISHYAAEQGRHSEAILYLERWQAELAQSGAKNPNTAQSLLNLGREYRHVGAMKSAEDNFYAALASARASQGNPAIIKMAQWEIAETAYIKRDFERASHLFGMFTEGYNAADPMTQSAFYRIGDCYQSLSDENQAAIAYERALGNNDRHPMAPEAYLSLMEIFMKRENFTLVSKALKDLATSVSNRPATEINYWKRRSGEMLFRQLFDKGSYKSSSKILDSLALIDPSQAWQDQIKHWRARVHIGLAEWDKALENLPVAPAAVEVATTGTIAPPNLKDKEPEIDPISLKYTEICKWIIETEKKQNDLRLPSPPTPATTPTPATIP
jgi:tetratricopeptide (TPR) repeat protein